MAGSKIRSPKRSSAVTSPAGSTSSHQNPRDLLNQAAEFVNCFQNKQALRLYASALSQLDRLQPTEENQMLKIEALQSFGFLLLDEGRFEEAKENLQKAVELSPDEGYEKYMYLAQMSKGSEAVALYQVGIDIIKRSLEATSETDISIQEKLKRALSNAYCAISEIYTTDLCDEPEAESCCLEAVENAKQADESNPQAWLSAANVLAIKARDDEARQALEKCHSLYWPRVEQAISTIRSRESGSANAVDNDEEIGAFDLEELSGIPFGAHLQMATLMMELDMFERAAEILEAMLEEDDGDVEIFYFLTVIGKKLWVNSDPDRLRHVAEATRELSAKNGDIETAKEMEELLATLPRNGKSQFLKMK
ncbi:unnamed protein product [Hydatigera taeniaeformis]|uniref:TPR_REGION domain-containing protein n=1 Tax=Hydatigena taeniaeformis TaxID=6205 RepID=A0A0R3WJ75_HYDTA|nr:unnamed protein product [Hydatigera taeniaeformis]